MKSFQNKNIGCYNLTKSVNTQYALPDSLTQLQETLDNAKNHNYKIAIKAGGNSYSDIFLTSENLLIDISKLNFSRFLITNIIKGHAYALLNIY